MVSNKYGSWDMKCNRQDFYVSLSHFFMFYPTNSLKIKNIKKMKETYRYTIILHKFTKNHDHRLYCYWDMVCDGCNCCFLSWAIFGPFTPLTTQKNSISKNFRKEMHGDIITEHKCTKNNDHMLYWSWDMAHDRCNFFFFILRYFLPFYPLTAQKNENFKKIWLDISSFYTNVLKIMIICYTVSEIWHVTDVFVFVIFHFGKCFALLPH